MFNLGVSRPDRDLPDRPTHSISTWFQLEPMLPSVSFGFPCPRPNASGSSGRFSSPKPEPPDLTEVIYKSGEIKLKSEEIQQVLNHIWWDLARSSHSQQILAILVQILANLMQIWWVFTFFGDDLVDSDAFFFFFLQMSVTFAAPATNQNWPNKPDLQSNPKPTWPIDANDRFQVTLLSTWRRHVGFELGRKST